ncbi:1-phosphofructokinase family hexose kinase [Enterococcus sp. LJL99]
MILTITMNPSIDYIYLLNTLTLGKVNRVKSPQIDIGGKGINAARAANLSGADVVLTGFLGGTNGRFAEEKLAEETFRQISMISVDGETRNAVTLMHDANTHTEIVEEGPKVSDKNILELMEMIKTICSTFDITTICINGSVNSTQENIFPKLIEVIRTKISPKIPILVDVARQYLDELLKETTYIPNFIKPNIHEISDIARKEFSQKTDLIDYVCSYDFNNIETVMISCGAEGAIFKTQDSIYDISIPKIEILNPTGSGDATVGGYAYALENNFPLEDRIKYAMACGMSNAQHQRVGFINKENVATFMEQITIYKL